MLTGLIIYLALFIAVIIVLLKWAPYGYENENGFHLGSEVSVDDEKRIAA